MASTTSIPTPASVSPALTPHLSATDAESPASLRPLFAPQDPRPMSISGPLIGIIGPVLVSTLGMLLVFLGEWKNPVFLILACVAGMYSLFLSARIGINRARNVPVRPSWIAGVMVLTLYLGPATAMVGFVRLLDQVTGVFNKSLGHDASRHLPFDLDPRVNLLSAILLTVCATAFIVGCAVFWLEVVALRSRIGEIERVVGERKA